VSELGDDRERLRVTFDEVADRYDRARPDYPPALFDRLIETTGIDGGSRLLEVGCGTGKATRPFAEQGCRITCLELGAELATVARRNLDRYPSVQVINECFESWTPPSGQSFDLVFAATAWHWVDPAVRYERAFEVLEPSGHLAFWSAAHVFPDGGDPFFRDIQDVYEEIGEGLPPGAVWPEPGALPDDRADIEAAGSFDVVSIEQFDWEVVYDADGYIALLDTFSGHITMQPWQRERLAAGIRTRLAARPDGTVRRHWGAVLHIARRRP
jgi:SAM-dependent methyltransferase